LRDRQSADDGDKNEFVTEESTKETVKTIARGKPGDFRCDRGDYRVLSTNAHGLRVHWAPGFPCAFCCQKDNVFLQSSGASRRESADTYPLRSLKFESEILRQACGAGKDARAGNVVPTQWLFSLLAQDHVGASAAGLHHAGIAAEPGIG
jgi:hypothetical protein